MIGNSWLSLCLTILSHIFLFGLSAPVLLFLISFSLLFASFPSSSFLHTASLNLSSLPLPLFFSLQPYPHFLSLSANSRCLIHQHLLKLCSVSRTNAVRGMCASLARTHARPGKLENVHTIMCMHVTVSSSHFLACCFPSWLRKEAGWLTKSEVSWWGKLQQRNQLKHTAQRHIAREHANLKAKRFLTSAVAECGKGVT